jgi:CubicO group peptidase (beta-lactamase class C family)
MSELEMNLQGMLVREAVVGAAIALVRGDRIEVAVAGVRDNERGEPLDRQTVFSVASLTKPIVSYAVLQLANSAGLDLDEPLARLIPAPIPGDPRSELITFRHVLTHTCGLQNLRDDGQQRMHFTPGSWFSYSSLGFAFLQSALEALTGEPLEATMQRLVFVPLGMHSSSLAWDDRFSANIAIPHKAGRPLTVHRPAATNASYSLFTTASDYGSFVAAVLQGARLDEFRWKEWLTASVMVPKEQIVRLNRPPEETEPDVGWGLGWGIEPSRDVFFQWGKMDGLRAFAMGSVKERTGMVLLTNSNTGLRLMKPLAQEVLPGEHAAIQWLVGGVSE